MGLDITAYSKLRHVGAHTDNCENDNHVIAYADTVFTASFRGIPIVADRIPGARKNSLYGGCFALTEGTEEHDFRAGSYGGYGAWRDDLKRQFNPGQQPYDPFYELIWFSDCEGSIGPDAANELLKDFRRYAKKYNPSPGSDDWYRDAYRGSYQHWTRACELAADGGLIRFH